MDNSKSQVILAGQEFNVVDGSIHMDREQLIKTRLEDIPIDIKILCGEGPEDVDDVAGIRNLGGGRVQALVCFSLAGDSDIPLSAEEYDRIVKTLIRTRMHEVGDICTIEDEVDLDRHYCWAGITVQTDSIEDLFIKAKSIVDEIVSPLDALLHDMKERIALIYKIKNDVKTSQDGTTTIK